MPPPSYHPRRTRWQLLFVEGAREYVPVPGKKGRRIVTISGEFLREIAANHAKRIANAEDYGGAYSPVPVSYNHAIYRSVYRGEKLSDHETRRAGGVFDVAYYDGDEYPIGLYALIEWTPEAMYHIEAGSFDTLSPTTDYNATLTDQTVLDGQSLIEAALVHLPALDTIGRASDWLPPDAISTRFEPSSGGRPSGIQPRSIRIKHSLDAVCRMAYIGPTHSTEGPMENAETEEPRMDDGDTEERAYSEPRMDGDMLMRLGEIAEGLMSLVTDARAEMERESEEEGSEEPPPESRSAEAEPAESAPTPTAVERAKQIETERIEGEVLEHVRAGRLLARDTETACARMARGEDVSDLLGDYRLAAPSGRTADDTEAQARSATPEKKTTTQLLAVARSEHPQNRVKSHARYMELVAEHKANNTLLED